MPPGLEPHKPEYNEALALAIFQTNSIAAGSNSGIFPRTARLNHGCSKAFNSVYSWRENEGALVLHALKNIHQGEVSAYADDGLGLREPGWIANVYPKFQELLTTYTDTKRPRDERRCDGAHVFILPFNTDSIVILFTLTSYVLVTRMVSIFTDSISSPCTTLSVNVQFVLRRRSCQRHPMLAWSRWHS